MVKDKTKNEGMDEIDENSKLSLISKCIKDAFISEANGHIKFEERMDIINDIKKKTKIKSSDFDEILKNAKRIVRENIKNTDMKIKAEEDKETTQEIKDETESILNTEGATLKFLQDTAHQFHVGDDKLITALIYSVAGQSGTNIIGIQPKLSGKSGHGKSDACKIICHLIPKSYVINSTISPKALYYMSDKLKTGMTILCDDAEIDKNLEGTVKRSSSDYQKGCEYNTVIDKESVTLTIPPRLNWWFTSVDDHQSEQVLNRQFQFDVDESKEHLADILLKQQECGESGKTQLLDTKDVLISREIIRIIKSNEFCIKIPYAKCIEWQDYENPRNFPLFCDLIRASVILNFKKRKEDVDGSLIAQKEDFDESLKVYTTRLINQKLKLNQKNMDILNAIAEHGDKIEGKVINGKLVTSGFEISALKLQLVSNTPYTTLRKIMNGTKDIPDSGLLGKLPWVLPDKRIISHVDGTKSGGRKYSGHALFYILARPDWKEEAENNGVCTIKLLEEHYIPKITQQKLIKDSGEQDEIMDVNSTVF